VRTVMASPSPVSPGAPAPVDGGRAGGDAWSVADDPMLRKIARTSMDQLAAYLANPGSAPEAATAIAATTAESIPPLNPRTELLKPHFRM